MSSPLGGWPAMTALASISLVSRFVTGPCLGLSEMTGGVGFVGASFFFLGAAAVYFVAYAAPMKGAALSAVTLA